MAEKLNAKLEEVKENIRFYEHRVVDSTNELKLLKELEKMFSEYIEKIKIPKEE